MRVLRYLLVLVGVGAFAIGLSGGAVIAPLAATAIEVLGNDYLLVAVVAGLALGLMLLALGVRAIRGSTQFVPPDPEGIPSAPSPGHEFDGYVDGGFSPRRLLFTDEHDRVRDRLRETAIQTEMRRSNCAREEARQRIDRGTWTDDVEAAAYVGEDESMKPPVTSRIGAAVRGESWYQRGARRTARAIVRLAEGED